MLLETVKHPVVHIKFGLVLTNPLECRLNGGAVSRFVKAVEQRLSAAGGLGLLLPPMLGVQRANQGLSSVR